MLPLQVLWPEPIPFFGFSRAAEAIFCLLGVGPSVSMASLYSPWWAFSSICFSDITSNTTTFGSTHHSTCHCDTFSRPFGKGRREFHPLDDLACRSRLGADAFGQRLGGTGHGGSGLVQVFLISMVLGIQPFGLRIGSSPFVLIRELPENVGLPWTQLTDYLERIPAFMDGEGLNPLLQNYWMTIHPPVTFLGFASTLIPFAFALAGLWTRRYNEWLKPALPWAFFSVMIWVRASLWAVPGPMNPKFWRFLGLGSCGKQFAGGLACRGGCSSSLADPQKQGQHPEVQFSAEHPWFADPVFHLSHALGHTWNSSVHAFVDLGLNGQLLIYLLFFAVLSLGMLLWHYWRLPRNAQQDEIWSREFWMFIDFADTFGQCLPDRFYHFYPGMEQFIWSRGLAALDGLRPGASARCGAALQFLSSAFCLGHQFADGQWAVSALQENRPR